VVFNFLLEFLLIQQLVVADGGHVSWELVDELWVVESQVGFEGWDHASHLDVFKSFNLGGVLIKEFSALNFIGNVQVFDSLADVLNGLDDL